MAEHFHKEMRLNVNEKCKFVKKAKWSIAANASGKNQLTLISLHEKLFASGAEGGNRTSIEIGIDSTVRFHLELNTIYYISEKLCWAEWMFMKAHDFDWKIFENLFLRNKSHNKQ